MFARFKIFGWLLFVGAILVFAGQSVAQQFNQLQWEYRVLVLSADDNSPIAQEQILMLSDYLDEIEERELIVLRLTSQVVRKVDELSPFPFETQILDDRQERRFFDDLFSRDGYADSGLNVTLVGFDGFIKETWSGVADPQEVFDIIDAMPMRQRELGE